LDLQDLRGRKMLKRVWAKGSLKEEVSGGVTQIILPEHEDRFLLLEGAERLMVALLSNSTDQIDR